MPLKNGRTTAALQTIVVGNTIPAGVIQAFGGGTVPAGWLLCDGSVVSRTTFAVLFAAISDKNGNGDGSTTFHLPDLRGRFLRGTDNMGTGAAGRDPDAAGRTAANGGGATANAIGSVQGQAFQTHTHAQNAHGHRLQGGSGGVQAINTPSVGVMGNGSSSAFTTASHVEGTTPTNQNAAATGGTAQASTGESRPLNVNANYIIKI
jgi:microcystin-dependent protein